MGKRLRLVSSYSEQKLGHKREMFLEDWISQLPDEILVSILSFLPITQAAKTSVLSHRWEKLWTLFTGSLNFDVTKGLIKVPGELLPQERAKYINHVHQVLASLNGSSTLDEFTLLFDSDKDSKCHIDKWVEFAIEKRVKRLELDMYPFYCSFTDAFVSYTFPLELYAKIKQPSGLHCISTLTSLCLKYVNVSEEAIECFLSNCPLLEKLCVVASQHLLNLKVTGAALKLKNLEIYLCNSLKSVEISAPNLVSVNYFGIAKSKLHVKNVPKLMDVSIGGDVITYMSCSLSSYLSQLVTLKLNIPISVHLEFTHSVELSKLKHLILAVRACGGESLLGWTSLIEASPLLHKFTLKLLASYTDTWRIMRKKVAKCPHQCIKVVEIVGFVGCATDIELAMYLFANTRMLEKVIIDLRDPHFLDSQIKEGEEEAKKKIVAKKHALWLKRKLPTRVDLVII